MKREEEDEKRKRRSERKRVNIGKLGKNFKEEQRLE